MATVTRQTIREYMLTRYHVGRLGTNTGTSQTAITDDANFGGHRGASGLSVGDDVMITSGSGAPAEEESRLSSLPALTTGTMNLDPGLTAALANNDTFEILFSPFTFSRRFSANDAIAEALNTVLFEKLDVPLTLVTDGDLLKSGTVTDDWTSTNGSSAKRVADFPLAARALRTTNTSANGFAASASISVIPGDTYYFEVACRATAASMTARIDLRDVSNSADITLTEDNSTDQAPVILRNPAVVMPSGCEVVQVRLGGDETSAAIDYYYAILRKNDAREFTVADRAETAAASIDNSARIEADRLGRLFYYTSDIWGRRGKHRVYAGFELIMDQAGLWQFYTDTSMGGRSLWYEEFYKPGPLFDDAAITGLPVEHVAAVAARILLEPERSSERWRDFYTAALRDEQTFIHLYDDQKVIVNKGRRHFLLPRV